MSNAPNEYRLVFNRHNYDDMDLDTVRAEGSVIIKTFTDWKPFNGKTIRCREASAIEFRYNQEAE